MMMTSVPEVDVRVQGRLGRITLRRERAINALSHGMITAIREALAAWIGDRAVSAVLIDGAGERGFCAGADIKALAAAAPEEQRAYLADEYAMDLEIATCPLPVVAVMHGVAMGAGIGIAGHARHRVVVDGARLAMPEVRIGLAPDAGSNALFAAAPGRLGLYLALTAGEMSAADALDAGFADVMAGAQSVAELPERLADALAAADDAAASDADVAIRRVLSALGGESQPGWLATHRAWIDTAFGDDDVQAILERLKSWADEASGDAEDAGADVFGDRAAWAARAYATIASMCPVSLKIATAAYIASDHASLAHVLERDLRVCTELAAGANFREGVRAQIIDKDRHPRWQPTELVEVDDAWVARLVR